MLSRDLETIVFLIIMTTLLTLLKHLAITRPGDLATNLESLNR